MNRSLINNAIIGASSGYEKTLELSGVGFRAALKGKDLNSPDKDKTMQIISKCKDNGLLLVSCGENGNVIRFMGPLTTPINQVEEALEIFKNSLN